MRPHHAGYEVPAHSTVSLTPGGKHIMLMGVAEPLAVGDMITATFVFATQGIITMTVPILAEAPKE